MICLKCDSEEFVLTENAPVEQIFKGETLRVPSSVMACKKCGWQLLADGQGDELRQKTADAYRRNHGLLTSSQIKEMRSALGMSQREFAAFLRVGEASVKRWETWKVQDASNDELMRLKFENARRSVPDSYPRGTQQESHREPGNKKLSDHLDSLNFKN